MQNHTLDCSHSFVDELISTFSISVLKHHFFDVLTAVVEVKYNSSYAGSGGNTTLQLYAAVAQNNNVKLLQLCNKTNTDETS